MRPERGMCATPAPRPGGTGSLPGRCRTRRAADRLSGRSRPGGVSLKHTVVSAPRGRRLTPPGLAAGPSARRPAAPRARQPAAPHAPTPTRPPRPPASDSAGPRASPGGAPGGGWGGAAPWLARRRGSPRGRRALERTGRRRRRAGALPGPRAARLRALSGIPPPAARGAAESSPARRRAPGSRGESEPAPSGEARGRGARAGAAGCRRGGRGCGPWRARAARSRCPEVGGLRRRPSSRTARALRCPGAEA